MKTETKAELRAKIEELEMTIRYLRATQEMFVETILEANGLNKEVKREVVKGGA